MVISKRKILDIIALMSYLTIENHFSLTTKKHQEKVYQLNIL